MGQKTRVMHSLVRVIEVSLKVPRSQSVESVVTGRLGRVDGHIGLHRVKVVMMVSLDGWRSVHHDRNRFGL